MVDDRLMLVLLLEK